MLSESHADRLLFVIGVVARIDGCSPINSDEEFDNMDPSSSVHSINLNPSLPVFDSLSRQYSSYSWNPLSNRVGVTIVTHMASSSTIGYPAPTPSRNDGPIFAPAQFPKTSDDTGFQMDFGKALSAGDRMIEMSKVLFCYRLNYFKSFPLD